MLSSLQQGRAEAGWAVADARCPFPPSHPAPGVVFWEIMAGCGKVDEKELFNLNLDHQQPSNVPDSSFHETANCKSDTLWQQGATAAVGCGDPASPPG